MDVRMLRPALLRCLPWPVTLAVVIILVDLLFFGYRLIGPVLFGILCFLGGVALGRSPPYVAPFKSNSGAAKGCFLFFSLPFLAVGILGLSYPLLIDLPDNASFMWDVWTPDGQHLGRCRATQIFIAPPFLWMGGVWLAAIVCSFFARRRSQENAKVDGGVSSPNAGGRAPSGVHPWTYTLGLYIILLLVMLRMMLSR